MLSNMAVVAIATRLPETQRELAKQAGVRGAFVRAHGDEVLEVVKELRARLAAGTLEPLPERTRDADPKKRKREEALLVWRKVKSTERKVTPSVVMPNLLVEDLSTRFPRTLDELATVPYLGGRRLAEYGAQLLEVLEGASK
jgi:ribonuclease D